MKWSNDMTTMNHAATPEEIEIAALNMPVGVLFERFNDGATPEDIQICLRLNDGVSDFLNKVPADVKRRHVGMMVSDMALQVAEAEVELEWTQAEEKTGIPNAGGGDGGGSAFNLVDFSAGLAKVIAEHAAGTLSPEKEAVVVSIFGANVFKARPLKPTTQNAIPTREKIAWLMRIG
jgi:hypothetical protein